MPSSISSRLVLANVLILLGIVLIGLIHLPFPFSGDQALFTLGASELNKGRIFYRDFWDLKPPGIYAFYLAAGQSFGFHEMGIHLFELLYLLAFCLVLLFTLRGYYRNAWVTSVTPLLTVGVFYSVSASWHLTQIEGIVGFPLFLSMWLAVRSPRLGRGRYPALVFSGALGGLVLLFKPLFLLLLIAFWAAAVIQPIVHRQGRIAAAFLRTAIPILAGMALPLLAAALYFLGTGTLALAWETVVELPPRVLAQKEGGYGILLDGIQWFTARFAPLLALAFLGAYVSLRQERDLLTVNLVLWVIVGLGVILMQRMWWQYHYLLLLVPLGLLAARGLDFLWDQMRAAGVSRAAGGIVLALLFVGLFFSFNMKAGQLARTGFARNSESRLAYQCAMNTAYAVAQKETAFLREKNSRDGAIFVFGDPIYYRLAGREQAIAYHGWSLWYVPEQWQEIAEQLALARPPYLFLSAECSSIVPQRSPETIGVIEEKYRLLHQSGEGVWYVLR